MSPWSSAEDERSPSRGSQGSEGPPGCWRYLDGDSYNRKEIGDGSGRTPEQAAMFTLNTEMPSADDTARRWRGSFRRDSKDQLARQGQRTEASAEVTS